MDDAALVARVREGDAAACEELVRRHYGAAFAVALAVAGSRSDAEDVCQDAWVWALEKLDSLRETANCPTCRQADFPWLEGRRGSHTVVLCGRNSVQISPAGTFRLSLDELAAKLSPLGSVKQNAFLLRFAPAGGECELTIFRDGRAIVQGTDDATVARGLYVRYVGG